MRFQQLSEMVSTSSKLIRLSLACSPWDRQEIKDGLSQKYLRFEIKKEIEKRLCVGWSYT